ncbi:2-aminoethylphosphonate--pyruvate transaminase [Thalassolituus sp. LLYu03]|uniref:2-aminoethylphosphonate--pyruvate transaminase n=1 Tax=Thalassolituus sp. LLYu03 TaxID=3421656 RepID=UPI003D2668F5
MSNPYLLLTPGPLSTSETVKSTMLRDWCTWDDDYNLGVVEPVRAKLVALAGCDAADYSSVLLQGSGSFAVESVISSALGADDKLLILANGAYGLRMAEMARVHGIAHVLLSASERDWVSAEALRDALAADHAITHVAFVHCETTSGILNPLALYADIIKSAGKTLIVDAMSSFGGIPMDVQNLGIDFVISSANKCIQGVPGMGLVIARRAALMACEGRARTLSLDLFDQWQTMEKGHGKWRFTSPTHVVRAFQQALKELDEEGGIEARFLRYSSNHQTLVTGMEALGFRTVVSADKQAPFITTFCYPDSPAFDFHELYQRLKSEGFVIYPGKVTATPCFRIGHIGEVYPADMARLLTVMERHRFWL